MTTTGRLIPPGPDERYDTAQELLSWMDDHFRQYGSIYKASVHGTSVYAINSPEFAKHVLSDNWQNYTKGRAIKRIGLLLGNGLMVSEGEFWKRQRRMIQPAFHRGVIGALESIIRAANVALLKRWEGALKRKKVSTSRATSAV